MDDKKTAAIKDVEEIEIDDMIKDDFLLATHVAESAKKDEE